MLLGGLSIRSFIGLLFNEKSMNYGKTIQTRSMIVASIIGGVVCLYYL